MNQHKKFHLKTFGCQMNVHDSEVLAGFLEGLGYQEVDDVKETDIVIMNTCAIRQKAEEKVVGMIGKLKKLKRENPSLIIGICGCMVQQEKTAEMIKSRFPYVDLIFGTHNLHRFSELLTEAQESRETILDIWPEGKEVVEGLPISRKDGIKAWVNITYGCNNFCSYCVVPYVRGREKSREIVNIMMEVEGLAKEGYKEVTLLGQNVNSYGKDLGQGVSFALLLEKMGNIQGLERIRYMTSHPRDFNRELIEVISRSQKVCEHFHLPIQSGSSKILDKMNRGYTREHYLKVVADIQKMIPNSSITTDFIVGFPGETEEDFLDTLEIVEKVRFDASFTFIYSVRKGTKAADMPNQIPEEVKKERLYRLNEIQNRISREIHEVLKGSIVNVLVEGFSRENDSYLTGRTRTNKLVNFTGNKEIVGKIIPVKITEAKTWSLDGEMVQETVRKR
ncbi:tRNA (N6-isopentenyl adenosine(37)-C2)-methylthiotransferase MiaB [Candidatus Contubernalis alkaliaceticus]|uniref:tRNA (N6-isopentenyl adenosine(37)-C2)-methylthiotransferase MiaB n=1 Tax=Candidatus Contubernalis alkaliaceticus TaxID=338645 RepID=UPI001F4BEA12|nr:tRNA (N6-isopentenyl adenosine(37)-C2)-methylthiotransferase MiaB [Candidatus Contubernalis alkalaceticus]UNC91894.1 tRNA (N6-isopentenyl adenosine(37)-C2)-methylthiotransferase MiaB [Candidatus Contubernalis alkalaceticus]